MIDENKNKGLPSYLPLKNGKFLLVGGEAKAKDNVTVVLAFCNWVRMYYQDFCAETEWLIQAPISRVIMLKKYLNSMFDNVFRKYVPSVNHGVTVPTYNVADRKRLDVTTIYTYNLQEADSEVQFQTVEI